MPDTQPCEQMLTVEPGNLVFNTQLAIKEALAYNPGIQESALRIKAAEEKFSQRAIEFRTQNNPGGPGR